MSMKRVFTISTNRWIVLLTGAVLTALVALQANYILEANQLKEAQIHQRLLELMEPIGIAARLDAKQDAYTQDDHWPRLRPLIDSLTVEAGFEPNIPFAVLQPKQDGFFRTNFPQYEAELRVSPYQACLSCVITIQFLADSSGLPESAFTSMRTVEETETQIPGKPGREEYYFISLYLPPQHLSAKREIIGFFLLTLVLTLLLVGVFAYILRMLNRQKKLRQAKDDFFNNLTHEFMTPLSSIRLAARMLKAQLKERKSVGYLDLIERESQQLEGQVDKILQLSLLESHRDSLDKEDIDLHEVVQAVLERLQLQISQKDAQMHVALSLSDSMYWGDFDQLVNAVYNLLDNALKYAGPKPEIWLESRFLGGKKQILIRDRGPGIPLPEQTEVFDRFYRSQNGDQYRGKGFGIGLSYVKAIAEAHGGSLQLNPTYREGCEFILSL